MRPQCHLVIFARYPIAGRGKRRLASAIGSVRATQFQRVRLQVLIGSLGRDRRWMTWLAVTPDQSGPWPQNIRTRGQGHGDLGQRMQRILSTWPRGPVVIIGTDIPGITSTDVASAFASLGRNDAVFGPAEDGGYWLVGLRRTPRTLRPFENVRWSTDHALADTVRNLSSARVGTIRTLADVDTAADLSHHRAWSRVIRPRQ